MPRSPKSRLMVRLMVLLAMLGTLPAGALSVSPGKPSPIPAAAHTLAARPWVGESALISGTSRYDRGEWISTDFVYDDFGADTVPAGQTNVVNLAPSSGDFRYPNGTTAAGNAADIVEVRARLAPGGQDLEVRVLLQSLVNPATPALWVQANGVSQVLTHLNADVDAASNTVSFVLAGAGASNLVDLNIGAGLHDGVGGLRAPIPGFTAALPGEFTSGAPTNARLFDLAFNTRTIEGRGGAWNEDVQSKRLAEGDLSGFTQTINVLNLSGGVRTEPDATTGYMVRLFQSRQDLGEGMAPAFPQYRGQWQPYAVWVPDNYQAGTPTPLLLNLHSLSVHHNQYRGGAASPPSYKTFYEQIEADLHAVVVTPLGRGPDGWYEDEGLVDTMEVWADARRVFTIDRERTSVAGYSMGGYGTYRLTTLMPDAFASAVSWVGPPANGVWAYPLPPSGGAANPDNTQPQLENTRHIPFWITHGVLDELVPFAGVTNHAQRFAALGHTYRYALHPAEDHLSFVFKDEWSREAAWLAGHPTRETAPAHVTFKLRPASWATNNNPTIVTHLRALVTEVGAHVDGAYWVSGVSNVAGSDVTGVVDLASAGLTRRQTGIASVAKPGLDGPSPYVLTGQDQVWANGAASDALTGILSNVTALTIDVGRAGLSDSPDVSGISTDTPVTITFVRNGGVVGSATR